MRKTLKRIASVIAAAALALMPVSFAACAPRNELLKIYNWGDYIEESLIGEFEDWYKKQTGESITVQYDTFDTNETMMMRIETQRSDYDLVCPSDYMAQRMIRAKLAKKVDRSIVYADASPDELYYEGLSSLIKFDTELDYFVPYIWGTFGIMYDTDFIKPGSEDAELCESWDALWSGRWQKMSGKRKRVLMKDSVRDAYSLALIHANSAKLKTLSDDFTDYNNAEYRSELESYFSTITDASIKKAQNELIKQKKYVCKYEVDDGKNDMLAGTTDARLGFFWSCDAGLIMIEDGGEHFYYTVPKEGSNVWVDGWLIPKYAKNTKAANYFLRFINTHEYAMANFDYLYTSLAVKSVMEEQRLIMEEDEDGFFEDKYEGFKEMFIDMLFPPDDVLSRCAGMLDFGKKRSTDLDSMWIDVKTT